MSLPSTCTFCLTLECALNPKTYIMNMVKQLHQHIIYTPLGRRQVKNGDKKRNGKKLLNVGVKLIFIFTSDHKKQYFHPCSSHERKKWYSLITNKIHCNLTPRILQFFCFFKAKLAENIKARKSISSWRLYIDVFCVQLYNRYVVFIKVYQTSTKQRQRHGDVGM